MGCCGRYMLKLTTFLVGQLKVGAAIAIICIVAIRLSNYTIRDPSGEFEAFEFKCLLGSWQSSSLCDFAYAVAGISLAVELALAILLCITCDLCGLGFILEISFTAFGAVWWFAASIVFTENVDDAKSIGFTDDLNPWRDSIVGLSWTAFGLFQVLFIIYLCKMLSAFCECLGCCKDDKVHAEG